MPQTRSRGSSPHARFQETVRHPGHHRAPTCRPLRDGVARPRPGRLLSVRGCSHLFSLCSLLRPEQGLTAVQPKSSAPSDRLTTESPQQGTHPAGETPGSIPVCPPAASLRGRRSSQVKRERKLPRFLSHPLPDLVPRRLTAELGPLAEGQSTLCQDAESTQMTHNCVQSRPSLAALILPRFREPFRRGKPLPPPRCVQSQLPPPGPPPRSSAHVAVG